MKTTAFAFATLLATSSLAPALAEAATGQWDTKLATQADAALEEDKLAWDFVEGITTEVGPRQSGTEAEARARTWAVAWLKKQGFSDVHVESYMMDTWVRGVEKAEVTSPYPQPFAITALGGSGATPSEGITAPVVGFASFADLRAAPEGSLKGKIAFISHDMRVTQDGSGYGFAGPVRWTGPAVAASKGAIAVVIRSVGTDNHRTPHTGGTNFPKGASPVPAGALSNPDADNLERMLARSSNVTMKLVLTPRNLGQTESGNVVAEVTGSDASLAPILIACHLDSWDLGTGAIDDGAGCGIIAAAAKRVEAAGKPLRTIRLLLAGAEETGVWGGEAYAKAHKGTPVAAGLESDFGADRIWRLDTNFAASNKVLHERLAYAVQRFGVSSSTVGASGGADIVLARQEGGAIIELQQDGTRYFDLHHTPDDTLDKIDPQQLRQNVAVWTQVLGILANEKSDIKPK